MSESVVLNQPIKRGDTEISEVTITDTMKHPGCLRGLRLFDVMQSDVDSLIKLLPRVTSPMLTENELVAMGTYDFVMLATAAVSFLGPTSATPMTSE